MPHHHHGQLKPVSATLWRVPLQNLGMSPKNISRNTMLNMFIILWIVDLCQLICKTYGSIWNVPPPKWGEQARCLQAPLMDVSVYCILHYPCTQIISKNWPSFQGDIHCKICQIYGLERPTCWRVAMILVVSHLSLPFWSKSPCFCGIWEDVWLYDAVWLYGSCLMTMNCC